jgi:DNA-binding transcriptional MerR regulator
VSERPTPSPWGIAELAELGGVSRRTVRYYVQEGLLPAPHGVGRGNHYGREHLDRLLAVKGMQEKGWSLERIRLESPGRAHSPAGGAAAVPPMTMNVTVTPVPREAWSRLTVAPGVEVHVASGRRIPPPGRLAELAALCRELFGERPDPAETGSASKDGKE